MASRAPIALVTGGAGFVGSHLVDALVGDGVVVRVIDDLSTGHKEQVHPEAELLIGDVRDEELLLDALDGVDVVYHLAARGSVLRSLADPVATDVSNTQGTLTVLASAQKTGARRVVFASSSSVYGDAELVPTPEQALLQPRSPYGVSKLAGEHYCRVFSSLYGLETVTLRYFNVYGPRQDPATRYAAVVPALIAVLRERRRPSIDGDGSQARDFTYVDDAVAATVAAGHAPPIGGRWTAYNVSGGAEHSVLEVLACLSRVMGVTPRPVHGPERPGDVRRTWADLSAAANGLGYRPRVSLEEGLRRTVSALVGERRPAEHPDRDQTR